MSKLHSGEILDDNVFELYAYGATAGEIIKEKYRGCWLLVDNGYHSRPTTIPPIKWTTSRMEIQFSAWLESLRKDVECTSGILKGRWRVLKTGIRLFGIVVPDKVFLTCCALHNCLLEIDGLDQKWEDDVDCDWVADPDRKGDDNDDDEFDDEEFEGGEDGIVTNRNSDHANSDEHQNAEYKEGNKDYKNNDGRAAKAPAKISADGPVQVVHNLSLKEFRKRLVIHFAIACSRNEVKWPSRLGNISTTPTADVLN
jgi:hypothetical protein